MMIFSDDEIVTKIHPLKTIKNSYKSIINNQHIIDSPTPDFRLTVIFIFLMLIPLIPKFFLSLFPHLPLETLQLCQLPRLQSFPYGVPQPLNMLLFNGHLLF